ncbi:MAG TPA: hypothetical protein VFR23_24535 [Jiangellaceae bacterium]|nr:hypothetical protein [Jiangellaceae bacterium]
MKNKTVTPPAVKPAAGPTIEDLRARLADLNERIYEPDDDLSPTSQYSLRAERDRVYDRIVEIEESECE